VGVLNGVVLCVCVLCVVCRCLCLVSFVLLAVY